VQARDETRAADVERELRVRGLIEPLDLADVDAVRAWSACDLASAVEGAFHARIDPWASEDRSGWRERLGASYDEPGLAADLHLTRYLWLLDDGERVGTIALPFSGIGRIDLPIWSLYVHPRARGRGVAERALVAAYRAAIEHGFAGIELETHWVWQRAVRYYLARRMWVVGWRRAITFAWRPSLPRYELIEDGALTLSTGDGPAWIARHDGDRLSLAHGVVRDPAVSVYGHATIAVAAAVRGWPLVRSDEAWARRNTRTDIGEVEALACRIRRFEAMARGNEWDVRTPRIPGLPEE
jgi:ribosomal protein S18 acetylase RimI-like enzyme